MPGQPIPITEQEIENLPSRIQGVLEDAHAVTAAPDVHPANGWHEVADVRHRSTNTISVEDPSYFEAHVTPLLGHEGTHIVQNQLPGPIENAIPADNRRNPAAMYDLSNLPELAKQGVTVWELPREKSAAIVQTYEADPSMRKQLQPWINQIEDTPLSAMEPTAPNAKTINMTPRPPSAADEQMYRDQVAREIQAAEVHNPPRR